MNLQIKGVVEPKPNEEFVIKEERMWNVRLPVSFKNFLQRYNGGVPTQKTFLYNNHEYAIDRFLCVLEKTEGNKYGSYDIDVVLSQIEDRLTSNEDLVGCELLPIAQLFAGDYLCLDYNNKKTPSVCVWNHEESGELNPVTYRVADSFEQFLEMLH